MTIPLRPVDAPPVAAHRHEEAPYSAYIASSLALAVGGGFALALLLPLAQTLEWDWGTHWPALVQVHGDLQLNGFAGLFVAGMALRLMPRFSGAPLAHPALARAVAPLVVAALVARAVAQPSADSTARDVALVASALLLLAATIAFAAIVFRMLLRPSSRADATGWFFVLGATGWVAAALLNLWLVREMVRDSAPFVSVSRQSALVFLQLYGALLMFVAGVSTRAVPTFTGRPRAVTLGKITAVVFAAGVTLYDGAVLRATSSYSSTIARLEDLGLLVVATALLSVVWMSGVVHPRANRVGAAARYHFQLVRAALAWLAFAALLTAWYAARALRDGTTVDAFEIDAIRHTLTVGVVTMLIAGMGMMILPEFAGRRIQHPRETWLVLSMLIALNAAAVLRVWPAIEGVGWLASTRYWPMAAAGGLAEAVMLVFALTFLQSWYEQRKPGWGSTQALASRKN